MLKLCLTLLGAGVALTKQHLSINDETEHNLQDSTLDDSKPIRQTLSKNGFGHMVEERIFSNPRGIEKTIKAPLDQSRSNPAHQADWLRSSAKLHDQMINSEKRSSTPTC